MKELLASNYGIKLSSENDAITVLETGAPGMIFTINEFGEDFFDLKNGILGGTFQKFANYRFPVAIVLPADHNFGLRVTELAREHAKHSLIRFCTNISEAEQWLNQKLSD